MIDDTYTTRFSGVLAEQQENRVKLFCDAHTRMMTFSLEYKTSDGEFDEYWLHTRLAEQMPTPTDPTFLLGTVEWTDPPANGKAYAYRIYNDRGEELYAGEFPYPIVFEGSPIEFHGVGGRIVS